MNALKIIQIIISILVIILILIQTKSHGLQAGVASAFTMYRSRRGVERLVFYMTIVLSILLVGNSLMLLILAN